jgi:hypothetical protein
MGFSCSGSFGCSGMFALLLANLFSHKMAFQYSVIAVSYCYMLLCVTRVENQHT